MISQPGSESKRRWQKLRKGETTDGTPRQARDQIPLARGPRGAQRGKPQPKFHDEGHEEPQINTDSKSFFYLCRSVFICGLASLFSPMACF